MVFDPKSYKKDVLVPLAKDKTRSAAIDAAIRELSQGRGGAALASLDLATLVAVDPAAPGDLAGHVKTLQTNLNKWGRNPPSADKVRLLLKAASDAGVGLDEPTFWKEHAEQQRSARVAAIKTFIAGLSQENPLGVLSPEALENAARGAGLSGVSEAELRSEAERSGLRIAAEVEEQSADVPPILMTAVEHPEFRTLVDLLTYPEAAEDVAIIDSLTSRGKTITVSALQQAHERAETARDSNAVQDAQKALGLLRKECETDKELHCLVRAAVLQQASGFAKPGGPRLAQRDQLIDAGINDVEAARIVLYLNPMGGVGTVGATQQIARALGEGDLAEARRLADALPEDADEAADRAAVVAQLEGAEKRKRDLVTEADRAISQRDFASAENALAEALGIDTCDDGLARKRAALPPASPDSLRARVTESGVELSWPTVVGDSVRYRVVRSEGTAPASSGDGRAIETETASTSALDSTAPVARDLHYAVFATRDGHTYSDPAAVSITALPPVADLGFTADTSRVSLSWTMPSSALGAKVEVHTVGAQAETYEVSSPALTVPDLELGRRYTFVVSVVYAVGGQRMSSEPVQVDASPRGELAAPQAFAVEAVSRAGEDTIRASWREVPGYDVGVWRLPLDVSLVPGSPMLLAELERCGGCRLEPLPGETPSAGNVIREYAVSGVAAYSAVAVDGERGVPSETIVSGAAPPATEVRAERLGDHVRLSWVWPDGDVLMEISWTQGGTSRTRRVTRAKYAADGGVTLSGSDELSDIAIATVVRGADEEWTSEPVPIPFAAARPLIGYTLAIRKGLFRAPTATVTLDPGAYSGTFDVELVLSTDSYLPSSPQAGDVLVRKTLHFDSYTPDSFDLELKKRMPTPYWLRLFAVGNAPVVLDDPPASQLKVKG
jgi:hypothetical protein